MGTFAYVDGYYYGVEGRSAPRNRPAGRGYAGRDVRHRCRSEKIHNGKSSSRTLGAQPLFEAVVTVGIPLKVKLSKEFLCFSRQTL